MRRALRRRPGRIGVAVSRSRRATASWCLFDWANSPFPTVVVTFVFAVYFQRGVVGDAVLATELWGYAIAASALAVALAGPLAGAAADAGRRRKPWLAACSALMVAGCAGLWFAVPEAGAIWLVLILVVVANFGFELSMVFYNAMLPDVATPARLGRVSGGAWAAGYAGGLACLALALWGFVQADPPPFGLDAERAEPVRATALLVAAWFVVFGWPLFVFVPEPDGPRMPLAAAVRGGLRSLVRTLRQVRRYREIAVFLLARMLYIDGLNTLFAFGGIYAAGTFGMPMTEVLLFGIALNVTGGLGAFAFGWVDDRIGARTTLIVSLASMIVLGGAILMVEDATAFWILGLAIGIFIGPVQSASRSLMARFAPPHLRAEMFGLFALSGRATAFVGPWLVGMLTAAFASQRAGMAVILVFLAAGLAVLLLVREAEGAAAADAG